MPRISYPDLSKSPEHIRKMMDVNPLNVVRMVANSSPAVFEGFYKFGSAFFTGTNLTGDMREIAVLRAGYIAGASYQTIQHEIIAKSIGMTDAETEAVRLGGKHPKVLNELQQAVLDFVDDFIVNVRVSDANLTAIRKHLTEQQLLDLMFMTGFYMTLSRILETTGVPLDEQMMDNTKLSALAKLADKI